MSALVEIRDLVIAYDGAGAMTLGLDSAELTVARGETLAIVGESGSGKTTIGMSIGRLLPPEARIESGTITVDGVSVVNADAEALRQLRRDHLGFVFQNPMTALDPTMRIERQMVRAIGGKPSRDAIAALLRRAELDDPDRVMRSFPHELSGGMAQRVIIAMAIARSPKLIIADEPTASLDASIREKVMETLGRLREENGASMVILSHDLRLISRHADRVAVMYGGRVVEIGQSATVLERPAHPYTRALIAAAAGNEKPGERLEPILGAPPVLRGPGLKCAYEPRCGIARPECANNRPEARPVAARTVCCHFAEEVAAATSDTEEARTE
ncbi:ABC transporter ATP-binding protein [Hoeflea sp. WL0058]|uniref:ABC transporter ATP-binding protein n=1 Tax=Flavimaribacter sediminis TaxID=2865987 RepID=A0AAE2ZNH4_9HYPH|nr:ABC transporter ATP-binding protein [Flavimaribacter sediminis]MBW8636587.1 ABC transporter ATP-binding protein [Flavimaribacter sediminis]